MPALQRKAERFCHEYLKDLNATQAAIRAGYSPRSAANIGNGNVRKAPIVARLNELRIKLAQKQQVTPESVIQELRKVGFSDARRVMSWGPDGVKLLPSKELGDDDAAAVAEVSETTSKDGGSLKLKMHSKVQALEMLGKHLNLFGESPITTVMIHAAPGSAVQVNQGLENRDNPALATAGAGSTRLPEPEPAVLDIVPDDGPTIR